MPFEKNEMEAINRKSFTHISSHLVTTGLIEIPNWRIITEIYHFSFNFFFYSPIFSSSICFFCYVPQNSYRNQEFETFLDIFCISHFWYLLFQQNTIGENHVCSTTIVEPNHINDLETLCACASYRQLHLIPYWKRWTCLYSNHKIRQRITKLTVTLAKNKLIGIITSVPNIFMNT